MAVDGKRALTRLMRLVWLQCPDLVSAFDLDSAEGRRLYVNWYRHFVDAAPPNPLPAGPGDALLDASRRVAAGLITLLPDRTARRLVESARKVRSAAGAARLRKSARRLVPTAGSGQVSDLANRRSGHRPGFNLIGYETGALGLGQTVRNLASTLAQSGVPFRHLDFSASLPSERRLRNRSIEALTKVSGPGSRELFGVNLVVTSPDQFGAMLRHFGSRLFADRVNVLYAFWELDKWPSEWTEWLDMFDEIWVPSRFVEQAIGCRGTFPCRHVPVPVACPEYMAGTNHGALATSGRDATFEFLVVADSFSFLERKNPLAAAHAFMRAFPDRGQAVRLVVKCVNARRDDPMWRELMRLRAEDSRIQLINRYLPESALAALYSRADCVVSLHRAEGFGMCVAEAMLAGKPVIATAYSGSLELTGTAHPLLVRHHLVDVPPGAYPHARGGRWAEPDISHAAEQMRRVVADGAFAARVGSEWSGIVRRRHAILAIAEDGLLRRALEDIAAAHRGG